MTDYRIAVSLHSPLGTPLQADTLFGHLCWAWRVRRGQNWLRDLLDAYSDTHAPLVLSDGFPRGWLPMPALPLPRTEGQPAAGKAAQAARRLRSARLVSETWLLEAAAKGLVKSFQTLASQATADLSVLDGAVRDKPAGSYRDSLHASIDRRTGTVRSSGGLYAQRDYLPASDGEEWVVYARLDETRVPDLADALCEALADVARQGYGRDASSGLGRLEFAIAERALPSVENSDAFLALSAFVPRQGDPHDGWWALRAKFGRLGGWWATGPGPGGSHDPFKRPIVLLDAGSVFRGCPPRPWYGQLLSGVHRDGRVRQHTLCLPLEVKL